MSEEVKGVFVRSPNDATDPQWAKASDAVVGDEGTKKAALWDFIQIAKAIGTPVTGGELRCEAVLQYLTEARSLRVVSWNAKPFPDKAEIQVTPLSDAQAQIAALEAEVVRLREAMEEARGYARKGSWSSAHVILHKALKGGAA